jgi:hypothetical protein
MRIIGAGMAGCIAAHMFNDSIILECNAEEDTPKHKAVLRFRSDQISRITGIPFKRVQVHKSVYYLGRETDLTIKLANMYSKKVTGAFLERSIWDLNPAVRYIAPTDFHERMISNLSHRIMFNNSFDFGTYIETLKREESNGVGSPIISTCPMPILLNESRAQTGIDAFHSHSINTFSGVVRDCDVYQTIYFPDPTYDIYRATITGSQMIIESIDSNIHPQEIGLVLNAFGIDESDLEVMPDGKHEQRLGKIIPINNKERRDFIHKMSTQFNIYSLGRFATWRNILLDDIVSDVERIKDLIEPWRTK